MSAAGKKRACFFLSDAAIAALKKHKAEAKSESISNTLESLLTAAPPTPTRTEVATKILTVNEPTAEQKIILEQAQKVAETFKVWKQNPGTAAGARLGEEAGKLAELF